MKIEVKPEEYYKIKDNCRAGLLKYLEKAVTLLPRTDNPKILDIGCGTGVPTIWFAENYGGKITAIDTDDQALEWFRKKIIISNLEESVTVTNVSFFDMRPEPLYYDIILAEGFLNVVGFVQGFVKVFDLLKEGGYFLIHDEYKDHEMKCEFIIKHGCELTGTIFLDETVWWNDYYRQLETEINSPSTFRMKHFFDSEIKEIESYKLNPALFKSLYYIVKK